MMNKKFIKNLGLNSIKDLEPKVINLIKWNIIIEGVAVIIFAFTSPIIIITMISEVDPIYYQASRLIEYGLGGFINLWINKNKLNLLRKYFSYLCIADCSLTIICNYMFAHMPNYRFIAISILNVLISSLVFRIIDDIMNNLTTGSNLSVLNGKREGFEQVSTLVGTILIMLVTYLNLNISCDTALTLQCIAFIIVCIAELFITKKLIKYRK